MKTTKKEKILPCVRHQNADASVSSRRKIFSNHKSETGIRSTNESTIAKAIVNIDTDCLLRSVIINTHIVRIFPSNPTQIIIGVKRINKFCVNVPSSNSNSFNVQVVVIFF